MRIEIILDCVELTLYKNITLGTAQKNIGSTP